MIVIFEIITVPNKISNMYTLFLLFTLILCCFLNWFGERLKIQQAPQSWPEKKNLIRNGFT